MKKDELSKWSGRIVVTTVSARECLFFIESITQLLEEMKEKKFDYFNAYFVSTLDESHLARTSGFFDELQEKIIDLKELKKLSEKGKQNSTNFVSSSLDDDDPFGLHLMEKMSEVGNKEFEIKLELSILVTVIRISSLYEKEVNHRLNENASSREMDDWYPPSNFEHGTDDEREIWEDFKKSQNSRK